MRMQVCHLGMASKSLLHAFCIAMAQASPPCFHREVYQSVVKVFLRPCRILERHSCVPLQNIQILLWRKKAQLHCGLFCETGRTVHPPAWQLYTPLLPNVFLLPMLSVRLARPRHGSAVGALFFHLGGVMWDNTYEKKKANNRSKLYFLIHQTCRNMENKIRGSMRKLHFSSLALL